VHRYRTARYSTVVGGLLSALLLSGVSLVQNKGQNAHTCKFGAGGVWMNGTDPLDYYVWRVEFLPEIQAKLVTAENLNGTITISDLELAALLIHWLVLERLALTLEYKHVGTFCDNTPKVVWEGKLTSSKSEIAAFLLRALGLRQHITRASPLLCVSTAGVNNILLMKRHGHLGTRPCSNLMHRSPSISIKNSLFHSSPLGKNTKFRTHYLRA